MRSVHPKAVILACCALIVLAGCSGSGDTHTRDASQRTGPIKSSAILAGYASETREQHARADGYYHVDTPATIAELRRLHVNTYLYLVWRSPTDWSDFTNEFIAAAQRAGIKVWVYIVPPSECSATGWCSRPYRTNYVKWAREIARVSAKFSNLTAWAIDDFTNGKNAETFTPSYMQELKMSAAAANPKLELYTTAYYPTAIDDAFYEKYSPYIKGIIFPYRDHPFPNTENTSTLGSELGDVTSHARRFGLRVELMIYTGRYSAFDEPTVAYVRAALKTGLDYARRGRIDGIVSYATPHRGDAAVSSDITAMRGRGSLVVQDYGGRTEAGTYASGSQRVTVNPDARRYAVSFWRYNRYYTKPVAGRLMQVLVDGHIVWSSDISTDVSSGSHEFRWLVVEGPIEIDPSYLRGKTHATLTFRVYQAEAASFQSLTAFDDVQTAGFDVQDPDFETAGTWATRSTFPNLIPSQDIYDPQLPSHVFRAVATAFGAR